MALGQSVRRALTGALARRSTIEPPELGGLKLVLPDNYVETYGAGYEPSVTAAISRSVAAGAVCADAGAHVGYFTFLMAHLAGPAGRVVAFEARPENARLVRRSAKLNAPRAAVEVVQAAVTDGATDSIELFPGRTGGEMEWTISQAFAEREDIEPTVRRPVRVPTVRLDDVFGPGERLDVVKMDIEGGEAVAVAGARRILGEQRPVFVMEFHRDVGWPGLAELIAADYAFEDLDGRPIETPADAETAPYQFVARPR